MKLNKKAVATSLFVVAFIGLGLASNAQAHPGEAKVAPDSSIQQCVAQIGKQADYSNAGRVLHVVESKERRVSGYSIKIDTRVFDSDSGELVREYATYCAVASNSEMRAFKLRVMGD